MPCQARLGTLCTLTSISGWLFAIVRRECMRLAARLGGDAGRLRADETARTPRADVSDQDLRIDLAAAIESLPGHYRDVVILRDFEELTVDEIATALALTRGSVKADCIAPAGCGANICADDSSNCCGRRGRSVDSRPHEPQSRRLSAAGGDPRRR